MTSCRLYPLVSLAILLAIPAGAFAVAVPLENAYWRLEEGPAGTPVAATDPVEDGAVIDVTGNGNNMRRYGLANAPIYTTELPLDYVPATGQLNTLALRFSGTYQDLYTDDALHDNYPKHINAPIVTAFTLEASFKADVAIGKFQTIVSKESKSDDTTTDFPPLALKIMDTGKIWIELRDKGNNVLRIESLEVIQPGQWYHAAVVGTATQLDFYLSKNDRNGYVLQGSLPVPGGGPLYMGPSGDGEYSTVWNIGKGMWARAIGDWFDGVIDEVRLSNTALNPCDFLFRPQPKIGQIVLAGMTSVQVKDVISSATAVRVYADGTLIGSSTTTPPPSGVVTVDVSAHPLQNGQKIVATQEFGSCGEGLLPPVGPVVGSCTQIGTVSPGMVDAGRTAVVVMGVDPLASAVKIYADAGSGPVLIGTNNAPAGASKVIVTVTPLVQGQTVTATQTASGLESCASAGRVVGPAGVIEDFEGAFVHQTDPTPGTDRTWYDVSNVAGTTAAAIPYFNSNVMQIVDPGWTNGVYATYSGIISAGGRYYLEMDMMVDETSPTANLDFLNAYQVGVIAQASPTHRDPGAVLASVDPLVASNAVGNYWWLTPQQDGPPNETEYRRVHTKAFTANAGDGLLMAFSTTVTGYSRSANASIPTSTPPYPFMVVDNIRLVAGEPPPDCHDIPAPRFEFNSSYPLEAGRTQLNIGGIGLTSALSLYADGNKIATVDPAGATAVILDLTAHPLVAGQHMWPTQVIDGQESCVETTAPVVGTGLNSPIRVALGVRETQTSGPIGADGGTTGTIEWIGATALVNNAPQGKLLGTGIDWQTVTFSSSRSGGSDPVLAFTGDGVLTGAYGVLEHLAFTIAEPYNTGRYVIYIDKIMNGSTVLADFEAPLSAGQLVMFRSPNQSGTTSAHLLAYPQIAEVDTSRGADGSAQSYRVAFQFYDKQPKRWMRLTTVDTETSPDMPLQNPQIDLSQPITIRLRLYGPPDCGPVFADRGDPTPDGDVDMVDFAAFQRCVNTGGGAVLAGCECFDFDFNGSIDLNDLAAFNNCAGGPNVPAVAGCGI